MKLLGMMLTLVAAASAQVKLPEYTTQELDNGVVVQVLLKSDVPMVTLAVTVRGGGESDPKGRAGLTSLTASALRRGTANRSAEEFSEQLDFIGASFSTMVDEQSTYISSEFLSKDFDTALGLVADAVLNARFPVAEVKKLQQQQIDSVRSSKDSPWGVTGRYYREFFYPKGHPYSRQLGGDEITLEAIKPSDLVNHHKTFYKGRNLMVTVVGDMVPDEAVAKITKAFGGLAAGERYQWVADVASLDRARPRLLLVDKPKATQTFFRIGQPGIYRTHPDRVAITLVNTLFGGRFTSMLNDALRVNAGLTYGAGSLVERERLPGSIAISSYTGTGTTVEAIDMALDVLQRLYQKGINAEQLASAKAYTKGRFPTRSLETSGQLAAILSDLELYDLGRDEIDQYFERIDAVTREQANAVIKKHFRPDNLQFVLVGDAAKIKDTVAKYADNMTVIPITKPGFRAD